MVVYSNFNDSKICPQTNQNSWCDCAFPATNENQKCKDNSGVAAAYRPWTTQGALLRGLAPATIPGTPNALLRETGILALPGKIATYGLVALGIAATALFLTRRRRKS